jgi:hypothetical protein
LFNRGLAFFAAAEDFLPALARIAPALAIGIPSFLAICAWTFLKPGCFTLAMIYFPLLFLEDLPFLRLPTLPDLRLSFELITQEVRS